MTSSGIVVVGQIARDLVLVVGEVPEAGGTTDVQVRRRAGCESALMVDVVTPDGEWRYLESVPAGCQLTEEDVVLIPLVGQLEGLG